MRKVVSRLVAARGLTSVQINRSIGWRTGLGLALVGLMMATAPASATITYAYDAGTRVLTFTGGADVDSLTISFVNVTKDTYGAGDPPVDTDYLLCTGTLATALPNLKLSEISQIIANLGDGSDLFDASGLVNDLDADPAVIRAMPITADGEAGNDHLVGSDGDDTLNGGAGNDVITGRSGNDTLIGGTGTDILDYAAEQDNDNQGGGSGSGTDDPGVGVNLSTTDAIVRLGETTTMPISAGTAKDVTGDIDIVSGFETINGTTLNDGLIGNDSIATTIFGADGDDEIRGGSGDDYLSGGEGDNRIYAGDGNNIVDAGSGDDLVTAGSGDDTITTGDGDDTVRAGDGDNHVETGDGDDSITTGSGDDYISAGDGDDLISAGDGDDYIDCGDGGDGDKDFPVSGGPGDDTILGGEGADFINGGSGDDIIDGGAGGDTIDGGSGNDIIIGGDDSDNVTGGDGNDMVSGGKGADTLGGGGGDDLLDYVNEGGPYGVTINLIANTATDTWGDTDTLVDNAFFGVRGTYSADTLVGDPVLTTYIVGVGGNDYIVGGAASDVLIGDSGDDHIEGHGGSDYIIGGSGNDSIWGFADPATAYPPAGNERDGQDYISGDGTADWTTFYPSGASVPDGWEDQPWLWRGVYLPNGSAAQEPLGPFGASSLFPPAPPGDPDPLNPTQPLQPGTVLMNHLTMGNDSIKSGDQSLGNDPGDIVYGCAGADRINGDDGDDELFGDYDYDSDNDGIFDFGMQVPSLGGGLTSGWGDHIYGGPGADHLVGGPGNDVLAGGSENPQSSPTGDVLSGNVGNDTLIGDEANFDSDGFASSPANYKFGSPNDTVDYTAASLGVTIDLGASVNGAADNGGPMGEALMDGDLAPGGGTGTDTLCGIENIIGSPYDDDITGSDDDEASVRELNYRVSDINGALVVHSRALGALTSYGLVIGFDNILVGGAGNDVIHGGLGVDAVVGDDIDPATPDGNDRLYGDHDDNAEGGDDWLYGNGGNDLIHGQGGDDHVFGGIGADDLHGDRDIDTLDYSDFGSQYLVRRPAAGVRVNLSNVTQYGQAGNSATDGGDLDLSVGPTLDIIANGRTNPRDRFEIIRGSVFDSGAQPIITAPLTEGLPAPNDDILIGHESLPTTIYGLEGNDLLIGGDYDATVASDPINGDVLSGNDTLDGGPGDDVIEPKTGDDTVIGGDDDEYNGDVISYATAPAAVTVSLSDTQPQDTVGAGADRILGCENLIGSNFSDTLTGNSRANWIFGGAGDDTLRGGADEDQVVNNQAVVREDYLVGGPGLHDKVDYTHGNPALVSVDLNTGVAPNDGEGGSDRLWDIEEAMLANPPLWVSAGPDRTISLGGTVSLLATVSGGTLPYTYKWEPDNDTLSSTTVLQPNASPLAATTYKLTVTDAAGRQASDFVKVSVVPGLVVDAGPDRSITLGQSIQLQATVSGGTTPYTYVWTPSDGLSRTDIMRPMASPNADTVYTLTVTDGEGRSTVDTVSITVTSPFTVSAGSDVVIQRGSSTILSAIPNGGAAPYTYHWTPSTGLSSDSVSNPTASPTATTAYTVRVTDSDGREAVDTLIVIVTIQSSGTDTAAGASSGLTSETDQPRTSPAGQTEDDDTTPNGLSSFTGCGTGASTALAMNLLMLLALKRRRQ